MDGEKIIPNTMVYLLYQEPGVPELIEKNANTETGKVVSFNVPLDKEGASYPFVVLYTKGEADKAKELAKTTTIQAFRTPSGENCKFLELTTTKDGGTKTDGCAIQMWSISLKKEEIKADKSEDKEKKSVAATESEKSTAKTEEKVSTQDVIITKKAEKIMAKITEIDIDVVKYKRYDYQEGPTYTIKKSDIASIIYQNGKVEVFEQSKEEVKNNPLKQEVVSIPIDELKLQAPPEKLFKNVVRFNPLATVVAAVALGSFELDMQYARYLTPKVGIPVEFDVFISERWGSGFALLSGIEAVPATHRQKSGLFLNLLAGIFVFDEEVGFMTTANIGYQLMTKNGFAFNVALGPRFNTITEVVTPNFMLSLGFAF